MSFLSLIFTFALLAIISRWLTKDLDFRLRLCFFLALSCKLIAGLILGWLYFSYYGVGDTLEFHKEAMILTEIARTSPGQYLEFLLGKVDVQLNVIEPRTIFFIKLVSVFHLITNDNYFLTSLYFSLISFLASWSLVIAVKKYLPNLTAAAIFSFLFIPSVVFWSSGVIKESIACAALFFLTSVFLQGWFDNRLKPLTTLLAIIALWMLWNLKYYYLAIFMSVIATMVVTKYLVLPIAKLKSQLSAFIAWCIVFVALIFLATFLHPNFQIGRLQEVIFENYSAFIKISEPGDVAHYEELDATTTSLLRNSPEALFTGLFRPFFWEANGWLQKIAAKENLVVTILTLMALPGFVRNFQRGVSLPAIALVVYVILLATFLALSTPNFGTLSRYKAAYLPFYCLLLTANIPLIAVLGRKLFLFSK